MDAFSKLKALGTGLVPIELNDVGTLNLDITTPEMMDIVSNMQKLDDRKNFKDGMLNIAEISKTVFKRSYPDLSETEVERIIQKKLMELLNEYPIAFGMSTREAAEKIKNKAIEQISNV